MNDVIIKQLKNDFESALALIWQVFSEYEAPDYAQEGIDEFYRAIHDEKYLSMLTIFGAFIGEKLVGVIATRNEGSHIALFFVDGKYHRQGIGKQLFQKVLENVSFSKLTVNASPFAVPVYCKLGFSTTDSEQVVNGIRFTPMEFQKHK